MWVKAGPPLMSPRAKMSLAEVSSFSLTRMKSRAPVEIARAGDFFDLGVEMNLEAVFLEDSGDGVGNVFVFVAEELRGALKNGDLAAEAVEELREFQADVPAAENEQ